MKKVTGYIVLIGGVFLYMFDIYELHRTILGEYPDGLYILLLTLFLMPIAAFVYYPITTKFGNTESKNLVLENLDKENEIIKKQIEKRELLSKLEALEKK
jgi:hypothetical protein